MEVNLTKVHPPKPVTPPSVPAPARQVPLKSIQYTNVVVAPAEYANTEPPTQLEIAQAVVSTVTTGGADATGVNPIELPTGVQGGTGAMETPSENTIYSMDGIEIYPEFPGGQDAFSRYLSKNLRYPVMALDRGVQGRVIVSFIIERNGDLSHIKILRGIGNGCDEEAIRVLAKSPQWKPGIQNKQNVRVAYTIPINFRLPD